MITQENINKAAKEFVDNTPSASSVDFKAGVEWILQQFSTVTRFEVIDYTTKAKAEGTQGRIFTNHKCTVELSLQDYGKTLKIFVK